MCRSELTRRSNPLAPRGHKLYRPARGHYSVLKDGSLIGEVTSGQPSPTLGYPVALAYVDVEHSAVGTVVDVDLRGKAEPFEVVALPFYKRSK